MIDRVDSDEFGVLLRQFPMVEFSRCIALQTTVITNATSSLADLRRAILERSKLPVIRFPGHYGEHSFRDTLRSIPTSRILCSANTFFLQDLTGRFAQCSPPVVRDPCLRPSLVYKLHYLVLLISADSSNVSSPARTFLLSTCILVLSCLLVMTHKIALNIRLLC